MDDKKTEELKKQAAILQEREKRMIAEERRAHKAKARTADAWKSVTRAKAYRDRVAMEKSRSGKSVSEERPQNSQHDGSAPQVPSKKKGSLLDRIMGD
ncbi:hypothetical protein [Mitsuokella sp.]|uniref:hypothetical protein n=1 Tax=Mitsuokella sp. TaxID=2049034 RepID=UPI003D7CFD0F